MGSTYIQKDSQPGLMCTGLTSELLPLCLTFQSLALGRLQWVSVGSCPDGRTAAGITLAPHLLLCSVLSTQTEGKPNPPSWSLSKEVFCHLYRFIQTIAPVADDDHDLT